MLRRFTEDILACWMTARSRKPLVLRGARQVGKSTLVRQFAHHQGRTLCEINLERHLSLGKVFGSLEVDAILRELEILSRESIRDDTSLLFLDEIQAIPHALQALRYLHEERPYLPVIAAGSLLEFTLAEHAFPMPVGRIQYVHLGPLTFKEFLAGVDPALLSNLDNLDLDRASPAEAHRALVARQRQFLGVGGMPEAVDVFRQTGSLKEVSTIHRSIAETYLDDFSKYARQADLVLLQKVFRFIARGVSQKIKYVNISRDDRARDVRKAVDLLVMSRVCSPVYHTACTGVPLLAEIDEDRYKLIFLDVGLMAHLGGMDWITLSAMSDTQLVTEGKLAEQFIGQHLLNLSPDPGLPRLTYWMREGRTTNAEVDYVWSRGSWIIPVEVKAGSTGTLRSLHQFVAEKHPPVAVRFDLSQPGLHTVSCTAATRRGVMDVTFDLLSLPLYAVEELPRLVDGLRQEGRFSSRRDRSP